MPKGFGCLAIVRDMIVALLANFAVPVTFLLESNSANALRYRTNCM